MTIAMIGLDTAKNLFQAHGLDESGRAVLRRKLHRSELVRFFEQQPRCTVFLEACGAGHYWGRLLSGFGHEVKLIAPEAVRPFVKRGRKNDAADAAALCVAGTRPETRFVPIKSVEQQAVLALHAGRSLLVKQQTMLANALRGLAGEFGVTVPRGLHKLEELAALVSAEEGIPAAGRQAMAELHAHGRAVAGRVATLEERIVRHARQDATARRLATIPGIGPITASLIAATVGDHIGAFRSARPWRRRRARARRIRQERLTGVRGRLWSRQLRRYRKTGCASSTPCGLVPDTQAHTHDGQRQQPRNRPDIGTRLTGSFSASSGRAEVSRTLPIS